MSDNFDVIWKRIQKECDIKNLSQLADLIDTSQPNVSKKKKTGIFPPEWAYALGQKCKISTEWIMTGEGEKYLAGERKKTECEFLGTVDKWISELKKEDPKNEAWFEIQFKKLFPEFNKWLQQKRDAEVRDNPISKVA
ncbi:MAG: hypothetical protein D3906_01475 [Candidatus Electrothrix sp. AUS1_2]|nr:hypothetical protein [Candidatus Electrothrix sp. AUS1_2]